MPVIRKLLTPAEIMPVNRRYNEGTDTFQYSPDGGVTWIDDPGSDPRHNTAFQLPPDPTADPECDTAARLVHLFQDSLTAFYNSITAAQFATFFMSAFLVLTPVIGILASLALAAFDTLIVIGVANIQAAFTEEVWQDIRCIIRCHLESDGQVTLQQRDDIMADIAENHPGVVYNTLVNVVNLFGEVLMSNAAVEYDDTGDCTECDTCNCTGTSVNFGTSNQGFAVDAWDMFPAIGTYMSNFLGVGWYAGTSGGFNQIGISGSVVKVCGTGVNLSAALAAGMPFTPTIKVRVTTATQVKTATWLLNAGVNNMVWDEGGMLVEAAGVVEIGYRGASGFAAMIASFQTGMI